MRGTRLILTTALAIAGAAALPARASEAPGVAFADEGPLELTNEAAQVKVCNSLAGAVTVTLLVEGDAAVIAEPSVLPVPAGACVPTTVMGTPGDKAATAVLVAQAPGAGLARRTVTVVAKAKTGVVAGALDTFDLSGHFTGWTNGPVDLDTDALLYQTTPGYTAPIPGTILARLGHGKDVAFLKVAGLPEFPGATIVRLPVKISAPDNGVYKGKLTGLPDKDGNGADIKVTVADNPRPFVLMIILGLLAGLVAKLLTGRWLHKLRIGRLHQRLKRRYAQLTGPVGPYTPPTPQDVDAYIAQNTKALADYAKTTTLFDTSAAAYKKVRDDIAAAEKDAAHLAAADGLAATLTGLQSAYDEFKTAYVVALPGQPLPAAGVKAASLLSPPPAQAGLKVGQATLITAQATTDKAFFADWVDVAALVAHYRSRLPASVPAEHTALRDQAEAALGEVAAQLQDVGDTLAIDKDAAVARLRKVHGILAVIGAAPPAQAGGQGGALMGAGAGGGVQGSLLPAILPFDLPDWLAPALGGLGSTTLGIAGELFVLMLSAGIAFLVASKALYAGNAWGTAWDYLAAFTAGAGAEALLSGGTQAVNNWRSADTA
jgi:hypothetical protein